jgi:hypothetical protein
MTLDDMLAQPYPPPQQRAQSPLTEEAIPELKLEWNGRNLTRREIYCLLTHVLRIENRSVLPESWGDPLALALLDMTNAHGIPWAMAHFSISIVRIAGPRALEELKERVRSGRLDGTLLFHLLEPLIARDWFAALPFFADALAVPRSMMSYFKSSIEARLEKLCEQQGVAADIWPLLMIPESQLAEDRIAKTRQAWIPKLKEFMQRGMRISTRDFRLLTRHPVHVENLRGLVLMIQSSDATCFDVLPLELADGDFVSIAHPLMVGERQRKEWTARLAREGRVAPFDQWKGAGEARLLDISGISANPADLMLHLESRGWRRGRPNSDGVIRSHARMFPDLAVRAVVEYSGIPTTYGGRWSRQTITSCAFESESTGQRLEQGKVSPIIVGAVMEDLAGLKQ